MTAIQWTPEQEQTRRFLVERAREGSLVLFVGAGVSVGAGLPTWRDLLSPLAAEVGADPKTDDPLDIAQWSVIRHGRSTLLGHVQTAIGCARQPGALHSALARIPAPVVFTTNYDQLLELAIGAEQGVPPDAIVEDGHVGFIDEARRTTVVKLHGCLSLPRTIVLTRDDYEAYADEHRAMIAYLQSLLATRTILFVGASLSDPNFLVIHAAIRRALGQYQRTAFLLDAGPHKEIQVQDWARRGIEMLWFANFDVECDFVAAIGQDSINDRSMRTIADTLSSETPPPAIQSEGLLQSTADLERTLWQIVQQARDRGLIAKESAALTEVAAVAPAREGTEAGMGWREKLRAILGLAQAVDRLQPLSRPEVWMELGDMMYGLGDSGGAIQAYNNALRPFRGRDQVDETRLLRIRGNLARAYARDGHHDRAEWLLRRCVFQPGSEQPTDSLDRATTLRRLNLDYLARRPTDASELVSALSRRAERLRASGHFEEAFQVLREARYLLEPLLGVAKNSAQNHDLFSRGYASRAVRRQWDRSAASYPRAYAFSFLGKCYRLSCALALDQRLGYDDILYYLKGAVRSLRKASSFDPSLPYPWAHRLLLQSETRLPIDDRDRLLREIESDLRANQSATGNPELIDNLLARVELSPEARSVLQNVRLGNQA